MTLYPFCSVYAADIHLCSIMDRQNTESDFNFPMFVETYFVSQYMIKHGESSLS